MSEKWRGHPVAPLFEALESMIKRAWCRETASPGDQAAWSEGNPAIGQCAITTAYLYLEFKKRLGGFNPNLKIMRGVTDEFGSHYWLRLADGTDVDLTRCQFPEGTPIHSEEERSIEYLLNSEGAKNARTRERMDLLKTRIDTMRSDLAKSMDSLGLR